MPQAEGAETVQGPGIDLPLRHFFWSGSYKQNKPSKSESLQEKNPLGIFIWFLNHPSEKPPFSAQLLWVDFEVREVAVNEILQLLDGPVEEAPASALGRNGNGSSINFWSWDASSFYWSMYRVQSNHVWFLKKAIAIHGEAGDLRMKAQASWRFREANRSFKNLGPAGRLNIFQDEFIGRLEPIGGFSIFFEVSSCRTQLWFQAKDGAEGFRAQGGDCGRCGWQLDRSVGSQPTCDM